MSSKRNLQALTAAILTAGPSSGWLLSGRSRRRDKYRPCDTCGQPCRTGRCGKCQARIAAAPSESLLILVAEPNSNTKEPSRGRVTSPGDSPATGASAQNGACRGDH